MSHEPYSIAELDARQRTKRIEYVSQDELRRAEATKLIEAEHVKDESTTAKRVAYDAREAARKAQAAASRAVVKQEPELTRLYKTARNESYALSRKSRAARNNLMYEIADRLYDQAGELKDQAEDYEDQRDDLMHKKRESRAEFQEADEHFRYVSGVFEAAVSSYESIAANLSKIESDCDLKERAYWVARNEYRKALVSRAGLPARYYKSIVIRVNEEGETSLYYGGKGRPDGPGHGHVTLSPVLAVVTYDRKPRQSHGAHNYIAIETPVGVNN